MAKEWVIEWEEVEEEEKRSKFKEFSAFLLGKLSKWSGLLESFIFLIIVITNFKKINSLIIVVLCFITFFLFWKSIGKRIKVSQTKDNIRYEEANKRIIGHEGPQGSGKTSFMGYVSSVMDRPVFSSAPMRINGQMTYKLTKDMLDMNVKLPYGSMINLDEITLFFDNSFNTQKDHFKTEGLEMLMQLIRHCTDGQMLTASVDMNRLVKRLEEKHGMFRHFLGQETIKNSYFIDPIIKLVSWIFNLQVKTGIRVWTYQTFENINHQGYIFDLSNQTADTKNNQFSNLVRAYADNSNLNFEYDDRYFKKLYLELPKATLEKWPYLTFNYDNLKETGFTNISKFFEDKKKMIDRIQLTELKD